MTPAIPSESSPAPVLLSTFTWQSVASGATEAIPIPFVAIWLETNVPCPL